MSAVHTSIDIDVPPKDVWDFVMDPTNADQWVTIHRGLKDHSGGTPRGGYKMDQRVGPREGYKMDQRLCLRGVNFDVHWTLTEAEEPRRAVWEGKGPARSKARIAERLTENGDGGTHFPYENEFHAPFGPLGAVATRAFTGGVPRRKADASLQKLKQVLETR